jgi:TatD DNase family protein
MSGGRDGVNLIDTHTHPEVFVRRGEWPAALARAEAAGVGGMIAIGTEPDDWNLYRGLAGEYPGRVSHTIGLHPCSVGDGWAEAVESLPSFWSPAGGPAPVALGECGLDRFHLPDEPEAAARIYAHQRAAFTAQLAWARAQGCPVVIHSRGAFRDCVDLIDASGIDWRRVVFHCFSEGPAEMAELMGRGAFGSFTGILTYKHAEAMRAAARAQGLARLMIETDAPWLTPVPLRGRPNEPAYLRHTAEFAASLFGVGLEELAAVTTANARRFFGL